MGHDGSSYIEMIRVNRNQIMRRCLVLPSAYEDSLSVNIV